MRIASNKNKGEVIRMAAIPKELLSSSYWKSTLFLFQNHYKLKEHLTTKYFDLKNEIIEVNKLRHAFKPYSHSEQIMLRLALHLFNERNKFNLSDLDYLDDSNKQLALQAIRLRFM
jgi:hypothetical protein